MKRVNAIISHPVFQRELKKIERLEQKRAYCRHDLGHLLEVARIAYIMALEEGHQIQPDIVYAAALLHDIGKGAQYEIGMPHNQAGRELSGEILRECGYNKDEISGIGEAIEYHNQPQVPLGSLSRILFEADKRSRKCFLCKMRADCKWPEDQKNTGIWR